MVGKLFMFCGVPHYNTMHSSQVFFLEMFFCSIIQYGVKKKKRGSVKLFGILLKSKSFVMFYVMAPRMRDPLLIISLC